MDRAKRRAKSDADADAHTHAPAPGWIDDDGCGQCNGQKEMIITSTRLELQDQPWKGRMGLMGHDEGTQYQCIGTRVLCTGADP